MSNIVRMPRPDAPLPNYSDLQAEIARMRRDHRRDLRVEKFVSACGASVFVSLGWLVLMWLTTP